NLGLARSMRAQAEQRVFLDVQQAYAALEDARERGSITRLTVQQAEENLDLVQGRYRIGRASSVELTDAQVSLADARADRIDANCELALAVASLKGAVGAFASGPAARRDEAQG